MEYPKLPTDIGLYWNWREMMEVKGPKEKNKIQNLKRALFCNFFFKKFVDLEFVKTCHKHVICSEKFTYLQHVLTTGNNQ